MNRDALLGCDSSTPASRARPMSGYGVPCVALGVAMLIVADSLSTARKAPRYTDLRSLYSDRRSSSHSRPITKSGVGTMSTSNIASQSGAATNITTQGIVNLTSYRRV
jgi:hypothetical protein